MSDAPDSGILPLDEQCIPIVMAVTPSSVVGGSGSFSGSVTIASLPGAGCSVNVGCDHTSLLNAPGGSWPFVLDFPPGGGTTANFTLSTNAVTTNTSVTIGACTSNLNAGNPANWEVTKTVTVTT